jgi:hypothetical protein
VAGIIFLVSLALVWSGLGIKPDLSGWHSPGTPLLFVQALFAALVGWSFVYWEKSLEKQLAGSKFQWIRSLKSEHFIGILLWLAAFVTWWREPLGERSYFAPAPTPPNFEYYPYSDAALYDGFSQSILIGAGRDAGLMLRPLYSFFLAFLHLLTHQKYESIVLLQIVFVAFIPVLVFLIASRLGNRPAGLIAAIALICREKNSIALTNIIEVSHSKLLLSDVPALALLLLFVLVFLVWLQDRDNACKGIATGAVLGVVVLIRSQVMLLVPVVLGLIFIVGWGHVKKIIRHSLLFMLGLLLMVTPWIVRNYQVSGRLVVENTEYYIGYLASGYTDKPEEIRRRPGESSADYYDRMKLIIVTFMKEHPLELAHFYSSHFIHNEIESLIYLPMSFGLYDLRSYVRAMTFWDEPFGKLSVEMAFFLVLNLGLLSLGLGTAVYRYKFIGLMPLLIHFAYSLSIVPMRMSGWRLIMPVDWVPLLYYSIGLIQLGKMAVAVLSPKQVGSDPSEAKGQVVDTEPANKLNLKRAAISLAAFFLMGLSFPLIEQLIPPRYPNIDAQQLVHRMPSQGLLLDDGSRVLPKDIQSFLNAQDGGVILYGRALYPSYYERGDYWGEEDAFNLTVREFQRLQFKLLDPERAGVYIPLQSPPQYFPHASDVLVIGCKDDSSNIIRSLIVVINDQSVINSSPWTGLSCSMTK